MSPLASIIASRHRAVAGGGGIAFIASVSAATGSGNGVTTGAIDTTGVTLLVMGVSDYAPGTTTVSDSKSNTWTLIGSTNGGNGVERIHLYYSVPSSVGSGHTFTQSGSGTYASIAAAAFSGVHASPLDQSSGAAGGGGASVQPGSITPSTAGSVVVTAVGHTVGNSVSIDSGFTLAEGVPGGGLNHGVGLAYKLSDTAENPTWSWSTGADSAARISNFKAV